MAQLRTGLGRQVPEAMACLENGFEAATRFYASVRVESGGTGKGSAFAPKTIAGRAP